MRFCGRRFSQGGATLSAVTDLKSDQARPCSSNVKENLILTLVNMGKKNIFRTVVVGVTIEKRARTQLQIQQTAGDLHPANRQVTG